MTLLELIEASAARLTEAGVQFGHGTTNAHDEAAWLVLWRLGLPLDTAADAQAATPAEATQGPAPGNINIVSDSDAEQCLALVEERIRTRQPAAYLTHEAWLQGFSFYVDARVIVPRSLIAELLVNGSLDYWLSDATHRVLDLCTGNGSLGIIAARVYPDVVVDASDISADALAVAAINVERHALQDRVTLLHSDGLAGMGHTGSSSGYDLIVCNPPYVNADSMAALPPEFRAEPALALDGNTAGGTDGMDFIRTLLREVPRFLNAGGVLVLEIGHERDYFEAAFPALAAVWLETSAGEDQVLLLTRDALL